MLEPFNRALKSYETFKRVSRWGGKQHKYLHDHTSEVQMKAQYSCKQQPVGYGFKSKVLCGIKRKFNKHTKPGEKKTNKH